MSPNQRREVGDICIVAACALSRDLAKGFLHVDGVPIGDGVQGEAKGSELLFLPLTKRASDFATLAVMDPPPETVAQFLAIELDENAPTEGGIVDIAQNVDGFYDAPEFGQGASESCRAIFDLQRTHDPGGL